jgi:hypothetical protein
LDIPRVRAPEIISWSNQFRRNPTERESGTRQSGILVVAHNEYTANIRASRISQVAGIFSPDERVPFHNFRSVSLPARPMPRRYRSYR